MMRGNSCGENATLHPRVTGSVFLTRGDGSIVGKDSEVMTKNMRLLLNRKLAGYTQIELAELSGTTELRISKFECGRAHPNREEKRRIAEVLDVPTFELFAQ